MSSSVSCCNACQTCINCNDTCNNCQSFCEVGKQLARENGLTPPWPLDIQKNDIIIQKLPKNTFYNAWKYVSDAANKGNVTNSGGWTKTPEQKDFIYADQTNELIQGIDSLGGVSCGVGPFQKDKDIIYASYFKAIAEAMNNLQLKWNACDNCDSNCNVSCDTCNSCDSCNTDNSYWPSSWFGSWSGSWSGSDATP